MEPLKITTLGGLSIQRGESPVTGFVSRKVDALLVYLAYERREHPRELLAELLWDDRTQDRALSNLRTVISSLQGQLAPYLTVSRYSVALSPDAECWLDAAALSTALSAAELHWVRGATLPADTAAALDRALASYQGDFLSGFHIRDARQFEDWRIAVQEHLRTQLTDGLDRGVRWAIRYGQPEAGIGYARKLVGLDPLIEDAHRALMLFYAQTGKLSAALAQYQACIKVLREELDADPDPETTALYEKLQAGQIAAAPQAPITVRRVVPAPPTPFMARPAELEHIAALLNGPDCRLLTLTGPGGIGKTRLAVQAATTLEGFPDGVYFIGLAGLDNPAYLVPQMAETLGAVLKSTDDLTTQLLKYLSERRLLLVLDNLEHLIAAAAPLLTRILDAAPGVRVLVTSRERLNIGGEHLLPIEGLSTPPEGESDPVRLAAYASVRLLLSAAGRSNTHFQPTPDDWPALADICRLVEGLPLGLELAAAWFPSLSPAEVAAEIRHNLDFLETTQRDTPARHRSLRAVFDYTWAVLSERERATFARLAVFRGGFTRESAGRVAEASLPVLNALVGKSLLRRAGGGRYTIHELLRQYAARILAESPQVEGEVLAAHGLYFANFLNTINDRYVNRATQGLIDEVSAEIDNVRAAWQYALDTGATALIAKMVHALHIYYLFHARYREGAELFAVAIERATQLHLVGDGVAFLHVYQGVFYKNMGRYAEGQAMLDAVLPSLAPLTLERATALGTLAGIHYALGNYALSEQYYAESLPIYQHNNAGTRLANTYMHLGNIAILKGDVDDAYRHLSHSLTLFRGLGSAWGAGASLVNLGDLAYKTGDYARSAGYFEEALTTSRTAGDRRGEAVALINMGRALCGLARYEEAIPLSMESLALCRELGYKWGQAFAHAHLARAYIGRGEYAPADANLNDALQLAHRIGSKWIVGFTLRQMATLALYKGDAALAREVGLQALGVAREVGTVPLQLDCLVAVAQTALNDENVRLAALVAAHPQAEHETHSLAHALLKEAERQLPDRAYQTAREQGAKWPLESALAAVLGG